MTDKTPQESQRIDSQACVSLCRHCNTPLTNPRARFCSDAHRMAYNRSTRTRQPEQNDPNTQPEHAETATITPTTPPANQPCDSQAVDWDDADLHCSDIARQTRGRIRLPGDPGYTGCCVQVGGQWMTQRQARAVHA